MSKSISNEDKDYQPKEHKLSDFEEQDPVAAVMWTIGMKLEEIEKKVILSAFRSYRGNKTATAGSLGIAIRTLDSKLDRYKEDGKKAKQNEQKRYDDRQRFIDRQRGFTTDANGAIIPLNQISKEAAKIGDGDNAGKRVEPASQVSKK